MHRCYCGHFNSFNMQLYWGLSMLNYFMQNTFNRYSNNYYTQNYYNQSLLSDYYYPQEQVVGTLLSDISTSTSIFSQPTALPPATTKTETLKSGDMLVGNLLLNNSSSSTNYTSPYNNKTFNTVSKTRIENIPDKNLSSSKLSTPKNLTTQVKSQTKPPAVLNKPSSSSKEKVTTKNTRTNNKNNEDLTIKNSDGMEIRNTGSKVIIGSAIQKRIKQIANSLKCDYNDLLGLIYSESTFRTVPLNWNGKSAVGLIQFTDICIRDLNLIYNTNLTKSKIAKMSAMEQLYWTEKALLRAKQVAGFDVNHKLSAGELYAITYAPKYAKRSQFVTKRGDGLYEGNEGLDRDKNGRITHSELAERIKVCSTKVVG